MPVTSSVEEMGCTRGVIAGLVCPSLGGDADRIVALCDQQAGERVAQDMERDARKRRAVARAPEAAGRDVSPCRATNEHEGTSTEYDRGA